jgi:hypothetical protein
MWTKDNNYFISSRNIIANLFENCIGFMVFWGECKERKKEFAKVYLISKYNKQQL